MTSRSLRGQSGLSGVSFRELSPAGRKTPRAGDEMRAGEAAFAGDEMREGVETPMRPGEIIHAGDAETVARVRRSATMRMPQLEARESAAESAADERCICVGVAEFGAATMLEMEYVFFMCTSSESTSIGVLEAAVEPRDTPRSTLTSSDAVAGSELLMFLLSTLAIESVLFPLPLPCATLLLRLRDLTTTAAGDTSATTLSVDANVYCEGTSEMAVSDGGASLSGDRLHWRIGLRVLSRELLPRVAFALPPEPRSTDTPPPPPPAPAAPPPTRLVRLATEKRMLPPCCQLITRPFMPPAAPGAPFTPGTAPGISSSPRSRLTGGSHRSRYSRHMRKLRAQGTHDWVEQSSERSLLRDDRCARALPHFPEHHLLITEKRELLCAAHLRNRNEKRTRKKRLLECALGDSAPKK